MAAPNAASEGSIGRSGYRLATNASGHSQPGSGCPPQSGAEGDTAEVISLSARWVHDLRCGDPLAGRFASLQFAGVISSTRRLRPGSPLRTAR
jgi:hypothetical protein